MDATNTTGTLTGFLAGVIITVLSAIVVIPGSGAGGVPVAGSQTTAATGGDDSRGGGGSSTGLFGDGGGEDGGTTGDTDVSGETQFDGGAGDADPASGGTTGGTAGGTAAGGTTTGGSTTGGAATDSTSDGSTTGGTTNETTSDSTTGGSTTDSTSGGSTTGGSTTGGSTSGGDDGGSTSGGDDGGGQLACQPGSNGGSTDTGVSGDRIKLGATVAESGVGASFLGEARIAMNAVVNKVNNAGGICGRFLDVKYVDDGWDPQRGFEAIKSLVEAEQVFALAVVPSSEGLNEAAEADYFERKQVPVVGSDGMVRTQYTDDYIFPVAASTVTTMHVIAKHAWDSGARDFGLVYEKTYRFGVEGAYAFNQAYKRLSGSDIEGYQNPFGNPTCGSGTQFCAIEANQQGYGGVARNFNNGCDDCDFVAYLMEPTTAQQWFATGDTRAASYYSNGTAAAQPLFTFNFGTECGDKCDGLLMWTGYNPPIEQYANADGVRRYVNDLKSQSSQADEFNQFTEGAYLGMAAMAEALARTGPNLTRTRLMDTLHNMEVQIGLSPTLSWDEGNHFANPAAQAFQVQSRNGFSGWTHVQDYIEDPWLGEDVSN